MRSLSYMLRVIAAVMIFGGGAAYGGVPCGGFICDPGAICLSLNPPTCGPPGAEPCGNGYFCNPGTHCLVNGQCSHPSAVACGGYYCDPGAVCLTTNPPTCGPPGAEPCGNGRYCNPGTHCLANGNCSQPGARTCGNFYCDPGAVCLTLYPPTCGPPGAEPCGNGRYCNPGLHCTPDGRCR